MSGRMISASLAPFIRIARAIVTKWRTGLNSAASFTQCGMLSTGGRKGINPSTLRSRMEKLGLLVKKN